MVCLFNVIALFNCGNFCYLYMRFSVVIPAYKGKYLYNAIQSVLLQTYQDYELVIVDDCSPEDLKSIVDKFQDSRIRYYRNNKNCGAIDVVDNWNLCLSYCTGEYVICMGDDDCLTPSCLEEYKCLINKYPGLNIYHTRTVIIDEKGEIKSIQQPRPDYESGLSLMINRWNGRNKQYIGDFCYNVQSLREDGGFYKLPLAWASDDISAVRAAMPLGIANTQSIGFQYRDSCITITNSSNHDIKLKAVFLEKKWYSQLYTIIDVNLLSDIDRIYYSMMKSEINRHFYSQRRTCLVNEFQYHPLKLFVYISKRSLLEVSLKLLIYYWMEGLKKRFFKR